MAEAWTDEPTPSATVLLVRDTDLRGDGDGAASDGDGAGGLEVLLLERVLRSDFAGGALVFPGGKVDAADGDLPPDRWRGPDPELDAEELGCRDPATALATRAAAVRETFEEAGVLLATRSDGSPLTRPDLRSAVVPARLARRSTIAARWPTSTPGSTRRTSCSTSPRSGSGPGG